MKWHHLRPQLILNLQNGILTEVKLCFTSAAPRSIAVSFPFHITMVDDGTQQHHEHLSCVAIQAILSYYIYWQTAKRAAVE
jgi:hypothetical protein